METPNDTFFDSQAQCPYCDKRYTPETPYENRWVNCQLCGEMYFIEFHFEVSFTSLSREPMKKEPPC